MSYIFCRSISRRRCLRTISTVTFCPVACMMSFCLCSSSRLSASCLSSCAFSAFKFSCTHTAHCKVRVMVRVVTVHVHRGQGHVCYLVQRNISLQWQYRAHPLLNVLSLSLFLSQLPLLHLRHCVSDVLLHLLRTLLCILRQFLRSLSLRVTCSPRGTDIRSRLQYTLWHFF